MNIRCKKIVHKAKRATYIKCALFSIFCILFSLHTYSQDSIPEAIDLTEEKELKFQQFFFNALSQKSIGNYKKAIENLEDCNQILANDPTVFFEFSKNYLLLENTLLAKEYIQQALVHNPNNFWMLKHFVAIYTKENNLKDAIRVQEKLIAIKPKEQEFLVKLYVLNREDKKANALLQKIEKEGALSSYLKNIKNNLQVQDKNNQQELETLQTVSLIDQFKKNKSFVILKQILEDSKNNPEVLLKYSEEGISLFPAQPFVYLMKGKALNYQKAFEKALTILQNGIDFVIDNQMEIDFYQEMAYSCKNLGNGMQELKYLEKVKKLKS